MARRSRPARLTAVVLLVAACGSGAGAPTAVPTPERAAFDLAAVKDHFTRECGTPAVDQQFCEQVEISGMEAADTVLHVPTTLEPGARDRGGVICLQLAQAARDSDLGYEIVVVWDKGGVGKVGDDNSVGSCFVT